LEKGDVRFGDISQSGTEGEGEFDSGSATTDDQKLRVPCAGANFRDSVLNSCERAGQWSHRNNPRVRGAVRHILHPGSDVEGEDVEIQICAGRKAYRSFAAINRCDGIFEETHTRTGGQSGNIDGTCIPREQARKHARQHP
jgi:hypothetical protein